MPSCSRTARQICDRIATAGFVLAGFVYPVLIYFGLKRFSPKAVALVFGALLLLRMLCRLNTEGRMRVWAVMLVPLALCAASACSNSRAFMQYLPALVALALLFTFGSTLFRGPSAVETFARLRKPVMSAEEVAYCRRVTQVWVGFFALNGAIALWTALCGSLEAWAFYNGFLSYVVMGILFAVEFVYRHWRFRRYVGLPTDPLFRRLFPPRA